VFRLRNKIFHREGLYGVNLALSNLCGARCIFCPATRARNKTIRNMPFDYAKKIADEISSSDFRSMHSLQKMEVGENGDALLNPDFVEILRYIKSRNPKLSVSLFTNFQNLRNDISEVVTREDLVDHLEVNIDGHDDESYYRVKRIPYSVVKQNILDFLEARRRHRSRTSLTVRVITYADYVNKVYAKFGRLPQNIEEILDPTSLEDDFDLIEAEWKKRLDLQTDVFMRSPIGLWAERGYAECAHAKTYVCPNLRRVTRECFVAPNGDWYACCLDEKQALVLGNVIEKSISEVYFSELRRRFIDLVTKGNFAEIGYPCSLVEACQWTQ
jgi:MoaA/NifB/PqqE/SkfB family radical SAM enzyme